MSKLDYLQLPELLPHAAPMILIDGITDFSSESIHGFVTIHADSPFCSDGKVPAYIAIEYMAQSIATWNSLNNATNGPAKIGFLLGTRSMSLEVDEFKVGSKLDIFCTSVFSHDGMGAFDCYLKLNGTTVVSATLNVFEPKDAKLLLEVQA